MSHVQSDNNLNLLEAKARVLSGGAHLVLSEIQALPEGVRNQPEWCSIEALCLAFTGDQAVAVKRWGSLVEQGLWSADMLYQHCSCLFFLDRQHEAEQLLLDWFGENQLVDHLELVHLLAEVLLTHQIDEKAALLLETLRQLPSSSKLGNALVSRTTRNLELRALIQIKDWGVLEKVAFAMGIGSPQVQTLIAVRDYLAHHGLFKEAADVQQYHLSLCDHPNERDYLLLYEYQRQANQLADAESTLADAAETLPESESVMRVVVRHFIGSKDIQLAARWFAKLEAQSGAEQRDNLRSLAASLAIAADNLLEAEQLINDIPEDDTEADDARVNFYSKINDPIQAKRYQNRKIESSHRSLASLMQGVRLAQETGDAAMATSLCEEVLERNADHLPAKAALLSLGRATHPLGVVLTIQRALMDPIPHTSRRAWLSHQLADFFHNAKDYQASSAWYRQCNQFAEHDSAPLYSVRQFSEQVSHTIDTFDGLRKRMHAESAGVTTLPQDTLRPGFILGMPRSGTTLTEQILARHPQCVGMGERPYLAEAVSHFSLASTAAAASDSRAQANATETSAREKLIEAMSGFSPAYLARLRVHQGSAAHESSAGLIGLCLDKMPDNYQYLGWIRELLPSAPIIYVKRDPRAILLSCWRANFGSIKWAFQAETIAHRIVDHHRLMRFWLARYGEAILTVNYEDLVSCPEDSTQVMLDYLGLDWHDDCLDHTKARSVVRTASVQQVRRPIYSSSLRQWEKYAAELAGAFSVLEDAQLI